MAYKDGTWCHLNFKDNTLVVMRKSGLGEGQEGKPRDHVICWATGTWCWGQSGEQNHCILELPVEWRREGVKLMGLSRLTGSLTYWDSSTAGEANHRPHPLPYNFSVTIPADRCSQNVHKLRVCLVQGFHDDVTSVTLAEITTTWCLPSEKVWKASQRKPWKEMY